MSDQLVALAATANHHHLNAQTALFRTLEQARRAGEALDQAKTLVTHGHWLVWLRDNFRGSAENARVYMRIHRNWDEKIRPILESSDSVTIEMIRQLLKKPSGNENGPLIDDYVIRCRKGVIRQFTRDIQHLPDEAIKALDHLWDDIWYGQNGILARLRDALGLSDYDPRDFDSPP